MTRLLRHPEEGLCFGTEPDSTRASVKLQPSLSHHTTLCQAALSRECVLLNMYNMCLNISEAALYGVVSAFIYSV